MDRLKEILYKTLKEYAGPALNGHLYLTCDETKTFFTVTSLAEVRGERSIGTGIIVRIDDNHIIIEKDTSNKPVIDALRQNGIPDEVILTPYRDSLNNI
jgi:maleate cis-trans isomerase